MTRRAARHGIAVAATVALTAALVHPLPAFSQSFTVEDSVVSDPTQSVIDPEFDGSLFRMAFNDPLHRLWVGQVDPVTGSLIPRSGRGTLIDQLVFSGSVNGVSNGPEWAYSQAGAGIVYTDVLGGAPLLARAIEMGGQWTHTPLDSGLNRAMPLPSKDTTFASPYLSYFYLTGPGTGQPGWRVADDPASETILPPTGGSGGRWVGGQHAFTLVALDSSGVLQANKYDCDLQAFVQLTFDAADKSEAWMFRAPELGGEYLFFCVVVPENAIAVYRQIGGVWTRINTVKPPSRYPYVLSPEPFFDGGRSYVVVQCSAAPTQQNAPAEIWIATLVPGGPFYRAVTDTTGNMVRRDPETLTLATGPVIYYSEIAANSNHVIHRCATGLRTDPPTAVRSNEIDRGLVLDVAGPSPVRGSAMFRYSQAATGRARLSIVDARGREIAVLADRVVPPGSRTAVWDGREAGGRPAAAGIYLARFAGPQGARTKRFVFLR